MCVWEDPDVRDPIISSTRSTSRSSLDIGFDIPRERRKPVFPIAHAHRVDAETP
ncbi:MAG: hypothetical protein J7641_22055 [Cyanobacteria bacterium SID2]|nr:hypothetical protein [Cyanobacteria bacterium SID2]MBP0004535.1 hypothetical protein [Cyanobacteria bacterium SBC]